MSNFRISSRSQQTQPRSHKLAAPYLIIIGARVTTSTYRLPITLPVSNIGFELAQNILPKMLLQPHPNRAFVTAKFLTKLLDGCTL